MKQVFAVAFMAALIMTFGFLQETGEASNGVSTAPVLVTDQEIQEMAKRYGEIEYQLLWIEKKMKENEAEATMTALGDTLDVLNSQLDSMLEDIPDIQINIDDIADYLATLLTELNLIVEDPLLKDHEKELSEIAGTVSRLEVAMANLQKRVEDGNELNPRLQEIFEYISVVHEAINGLSGPHVIFTGTNVHIRTRLSDDEKNGSGNLIVGYNENVTGNPRTGFHNLIVGPGHGYNACGGVVAGLANTVEGSFSSVIGGRKNTAKGEMSSVSGGTDNTAMGKLSSVRGGLEQEVEDEHGYLPVRQTGIAEIRSEL